MPCPLCHGRDDPLMPNSCDYCYPKFMSEKKAARRTPGIMPETVISGEGLDDHGFQAWRKGKCRQRAALQDGKSDDVAEKIGYSVMEMAAKEELERRARTIAYHA